MTLVDLRSDTVTKPGPAMREAMLRSEVGDDVFGEDPTANSLEERLAGLFGHEAGLFCPSGTMTNQIAIHILTRPGDEVICDEGAHIYRYEAGGVMATSGCSVKLLAGDRGRFTAEQVQGAINDPQAPWLARTRLVNIENSCNRGGGAVWDLAEVKRIRSVCDANGLAMHLDGSRIFNAMAVSKDAPKDWGAAFDTVSICLSKGLGAPVGSVLVGSKAHIHEARRVRKRIGGGMRQVGFLAAACHHALDHHVQELPLDHVRAKRLEQVLSELPYVASVPTVITNIVLFDLIEGYGAARFLSQARTFGLLASLFGPDTVRMVLHRDISDDDLDRAIQILRKIDP